MRFVQPHLGRVDDGITEKDDGEVDPEAAVDVKRRLRVVDRLVDHRVAVQDRLARLEHRGRRRGRVERDLAQVGEEATVALRRRPNAFVELQDIVRS